MTRRSYNICRWKIQGTPASAVQRLQDYQAFDGSGLQLRPTRSMPTGYPVTSKSTLRLSESERIRCRSELAQLVTVP